MKQMAMPGGELDPAEARLLKAARALAEVLYGLVNAVRRHFPGHGPAQVVGQCRGRPGLLRSPRLAVTAAGILKLSQQTAAPAFHAVRPAGQCIAGVRPEQGRAVRTVVPGQYVQRLGHDQSRSSRGAIGVIAHETRIDVLVLRVTRAHRCVNHAIAHRSPGQRDRFEQ